MPKRAATSIDSTTAAQASLSRRSEVTFSATSTNSIDEVVKSFIAVKAPPAQPLSASDTPSITMKANSSLKSMPRAAISLRTMARLAARTKPSVHSTSIGRYSAISGANSSIGRKKLRNT